MLLFAHLVMTAAELDQTLDTEVQFQYGLTLCHLEMFQEAIKQLNYVLYYIMHLRD
jgi:hypothetical protein